MNLQAAVWPALCERTSHCPRNHRVGCRLRKQGHDIGKGGTVLLQQVDRSLEIAIYAMTGSDQMCKAVVGVAYLISESQYGAC